MNKENSENGLEWLKMDYREEIINALVEVCKKARSEGFDSAREIYTKQVDSGYKKGLEDAWECAKKVVLPSYEGGLAFDVFEEIFGECGYQRVLKKYKVSEAMQKITEYEKRQKIENFANVTGYDTKEVGEAVDKIEKNLDQIEDKKSCINCIYALNETYSETCRKCVTCEEDHFEPKQTDATDIDDGIIKVGDEIYSDETDMTAVVHHIDAWGRYQCFNENGAQFVLDKETYDEYWHKTYKYYPQIAEVLKLLRGEE
jgi:ribosomal protein L40E